MLTMQANRKVQSCGCKDVIALCLELVRQLQDRHVQPAIERQSKSSSASIASSTQAAAVTLSDGVMGDCPLLPLPRAWDAAAGRPMQQHSADMKVHDDAVLWHGDGGQAAAGPAKVSATCSHGAAKQKCPTLAAGRWCQVDEAFVGPWQPGMHAVTQCFKRAQTLQHLSSKLAGDSWHVLRKSHVER